MAKVPMQDDAQRGHWLLFRRPGHFFYDYAVRYDQRNHTDGECVVAMCELRRAGGRGHLVAPVRASRRCGLPA